MPIQEAASNPRSCQTQEAVQIQEAAQTPSHPYHLPVWTVPQITDDDQSWLAWPLSTMYMHRPIYQVTIYFVHKINICTLISV